jgi:Ca-activated chloride channel family protein
MEFESPKYLFLLFLLLPLIFWYVYKLQKVQATFKLSSTAAFEGKHKSVRVYLRHFPFLLRLIVISLVIIVLARPQLVDSWETSESEGIDIIMALDVSGSMLAQDFTPNRLEAAKKVTSEFITDREKDNIGLVIFSGESFTQCPLTADHGVLLSLLHEIKYGMIDDGTAIGLGLANAVNRLKDSQSQSRVVILLTDGSNNRGQIAPLTAADLASTYGVRVYTIGVGSQGMAPTPMPTPFGERIQNMPVEIDEKTLTEIAGITGGKYFRAEDGQKLAEIYKEIDSMEKYLISVNKVTKKQELYLSFAIAALALLLFELTLRRTLLRSIP